MQVPITALYVTEGIANTKSTTKLTPAMAGRLLGKRKDMA
jgi:hypothetical protein